MHRRRRDALLCAEQIMPRVIRRCAEEAVDIADGDQVTTIDVMKLGAHQTQ